MKRQGRSSRRTGWRAASVKDRSVPEEPAVSYRTFKHLLGETSLERKCRFIFGGGILTLVTFSFYWYGQKTEQLVLGQKIEAARALVDPIISKMHFEDVRQLGVRDLHRRDVRRECADGRPAELRVAHPRPPYSAQVHRKRSADGAGRRATSSNPRFWPGFLRAAELSGKAGNEPRDPYSFPNGAPVEHSRIMPGRKEYQYIRAILFKPRCLNRCHTSRAGRAGQVVCAPGPGNWPPRSSSNCRWNGRTRKSTPTGRS